MPPKRGCSWRLTALALAALPLTVSCGSDSSTPATTDGQRIAIAVPPGPGPAEYDRVWVRTYGPQNARHVLILVPGSPSGQGNYDALAPALVDAVSDLAVWTLDRRENGLEDTTGFALNDANRAFGYYFLAGEVGGRNFSPVSDDDAAFAREWGINVAFSDLREVVLAARDGGRRGVILGGHSMGAIQAPTYAVWDFDGKAGADDLEGLVLIDGGPFGAFKKALADTPFETPWASVAEASAALDAFAQESPFGFAGPPLPVPLWLIGVLPELACQYALQDPDGASVLQFLTPFVLPLEDVPLFPITNSAFFGLVTTEGVVDSFDVRTGALAQSGDPRPWIDGTFASVESVCATFAREPGNGMAWYYPVRIDMDLLLGVPDLTPNAVTEFLGLRPFHLATLDLPLFVFETSLSQGGVLAAAERLIAESSIQRFQLESDPSMGHLDPLADFPAQNRFFEKVVPFLRTIAQENPGATDP